MSVRDIGLWIKAFLEWIGGLLEWVQGFFSDWVHVLLWQTNWLDANVLHVLMSLGLYYLIPLGIWQAITEHLQHRRKLKEDKDYREQWELEQQLRAKEYAKNYKENRAKEIRSLKFLFLFTIVLFTSFFLYASWEQSHYY